MSRGLDEAIRLVRLREIPKKGRQRICAVITDRKGRILSIGNNSYKKTHPKQVYFAGKTERPSLGHLHAEISSLVRLRCGEPYAIHIARVGRKGETRLAKPCVICDFAIKEAGIKIVEYTT